MRSRCHIFISYRRLDSAIFSQWLATQLRMAYGQDCVFIDTENIRDAVVWAQQIESSLNSASLVIVVVGKSWLSTSDEFGRRRIDLLDDWVRREIETSLQTGKRILPLLVEGAELPKGEALPASIAPLLDIQARRINIGTIAKDMSVLVKDAGEWINKKPIATEIPYPYPLLKIKPLDEQNLQRLETRLPTWRVVSRQHKEVEKIELTRTFEFENFLDLIHFMNTASRFIDRIDHHPEWTNIWRTLVVYLTTWDIGSKPSMLDVDLAAYLDDLYGNYVKKISQQDIDLITAKPAG
jgi:pterin-4a-carbinolamine dehydratase